jgi:hypothetical protein
MRLAIALLLALGLFSCKQSQRVDISFINVGGVELMGVQAVVAGKVASAGALGAKRIATTLFFDRLSDSIDVKYDVGNKSIAKTLAIRRMVGPNPTRLQLIVWLNGYNDPGVVVELRDDYPEPLLRNESEFPVEVRQPTSPVPGSRQPRQPQPG